MLVAGWHTTFLNEFAKIATLTILHHQVDRSISLVYEFIEAAHDVLMFELPEYVDLIYKLLFLLVVHAAIVCLFPHHLLTRLYVSHQRHLAVTTYKTYSKKVS